MKKITAFVLAMVSALSLCSCGNDETGDGGNKKRSSAPSYELNDDDELIPETKEPAADIPTMEPVTDEPATDEPETAAVVTEPDTAEPVTSGQKGKYSDAIRSGEFRLDGVEYKLPADYAEFSANGWELEEVIHTEDEMVDAGDMKYIYMTKGKNKVAVMLTNNGESQVPMKDCKVTNLTVKGNEVEDKDILKIGDVSVADIGSAAMIEAFGNPDYESKEKDYEFYSYRSDSVGQTVYISIWKDYTSVEIANYDLY